MTYILLIVGLVGSLWATVYLIRRGMKVDKAAERYSTKGDKYFVGALVTGMAVVVWFCLIIAYAINTRNCDYRGKQYGTDSKFDYWSGCYLKTNRSFIPEDKYRIVFDPK